MVLDLILLTATIWRVHQDDIELVVDSIVQHILQQRIVVIDLRHIKIMKQHVGDTEHVRKLLLLNTIDRMAVSILVVCGLDLLLQLGKP